MTTETETYPLITLGQQCTVRDRPGLVEKGRRVFYEAVGKTTAGYEFFECCTPIEFTEILHQGSECAWEGDDGEMHSFDYPHYHLNATWDVCHDLLVHKLQRLMKPFNESLEVKSNAEK